MNADKKKIAVVSDLNSAYKNIKYYLKIQSKYLHDEIHLNECIKFASKLQFLTISLFL